jgi:ABC-type branched-subunit amino acid transport system substrate-binding protein
MKKPEIDSRSWLKRFFEMKLFCWLASLLFITSFLAIDAYGDNSNKELSPVKIGVIVPLTGGLALRGDDISKLLTILKSHLDSSSLAYKYEFLIEDGKCGDGSTTTSAAMKLINYDKVKFLITGCSGETLQAGPIAEKNKVLNIAVLSMHKDIKKLGDYIFRTFVDIEKSINGFADYMDSQCDGKIAVLTEENAFTFGVRDLLVKHLGSKIVLVDDFPANSADFSTLLAKVNSKGAKGIYLNVMSDGTLANLVNQARRRNLSQHLFSYNMPEAPSFRAATGKNSDNLYFIGTPDIKQSSAEFNGILAEYMRQYPEGPSYEFILRTTFDAIKSIVDGVEAVGTDTTKVKDFLNHYSALGALGEIEYDSNGDIKNLHYVLKRVREDGKNEIVGELVKSE